MSNDPKPSRGFFSGLFGRRSEPSAPEPAAPAEQPATVADEAAGVGAGASDEAIADASSGDAAPLAPAPAAAEPPAKVGWFQRLKSGLAKTSSRLTEGITSVFTKRKLDDDTLGELEDLLIQADLGVETAMRITEALAKGRYGKSVTPEEVRTILASEVEKTLAPIAKPLVFEPSRRPHVVLFVGVNGTGKTTTIGKFARQLTSQGKRVMLAAGDTFRAAAIDQLKVWGERTGATVIARDVGADAAGLAFDALSQAKAEGYDVLLIDTAGRLQNKQGLMEELEKVVRVIRKLEPEAPHDVLLVLDATTGQNALNQVEVFQERAGVSGLIMTKLDGTARGGILVAIAARFGLPVHAIGVGESAEDLQPFDAGEFARAIALA
ncbi:MAG: signal recognition particle-docking protein FtsY [Hyphomicrobiaceae bacterium]